MVTRAEKKFNGSDTQTRPRLHTSAFSFSNPAVSPIILARNAFATSLLMSTAGAAGVGAGVGADACSEMGIKVGAEVGCDTDADDETATSEWDADADETAGATATRAGGAWLLPFDEATNDATDALRDWDAAAGVSGAATAVARRAAVEWEDASDARGTGRCGAGTAGNDEDDDECEIEEDALDGAAFRFCASLSRQLPAPPLAPAETEADADADSAGDDRSSIDENEASARGACMRPANACERPLPPPLVLPLELEWPLIPPLE